MQTLPMLEELMHILEAPSAAFSQPRVSNRDRLESPPAECPHLGRGQERVLATLFILSVISSSNQEIKFKASTLTCEFPTFQDLPSSHSWGSSKISWKRTASNDHASLCSGVWATATNNRWRFTCFSCVSAGAAVSLIQLVPGYLC